MKWTLVKSALSAIAISAAIAAGPAQAATVGVVDGSLVTSNGTAASVRYRMDNGNWDQAALPPGAPQSGAGTFEQANLGNNNQLDEQTFAFKLNYTANTGLEWTVGSSTLSLGNATSFNGIELFARATQQNGDDRSISVENLVFTWGAGLNGPGTLGDINVTNGAETVWLASSDDLSTFDWMIQGDVTLDRVGTRNPSERLKLDIGLRDISVVPLPVGAWLLLGGFATWFGAGRAMRKSA